MQPLFRLAGLFLLIGAFVLPVCGADKKDAKKGDNDKPEKSEKKTDKKETGEEYVVVGQFEGLVTQVAATQKTLTLQLINRMPDQQAIAQTQQRLFQLQQQLVQQRAQGNVSNRFNQQAIAQTLVQIAQVQATPPKFIEQKVDKQFEASDDVKVRIAEPPVEFDDKGKRKKFTPAELKEKKGPGNHWGFPAEFDFLTAGQTVKVMVSIKKSTFEARKKKKPVHKTKGKEPEPIDDSGDDPPLVRQINILSDVKKN